MAVYVDYDHTGVTNQQGNIPVLKDQQALSNAVKLWLCSFRGERLYRCQKTEHKTFRKLLKQVLEQIFSPLFK